MDSDSYEFGSADSIDVDVLQVVDSLPSLEECKALCRDSKYNLNLVTVKDGVIADCFKGLPDETNNALLRTHSLHRSGEGRSLPIDREVLRIVPLKIVRGTRLILSMLTRTSYRSPVKAALRSLDQSQRVATLQSIDFQSLTLSVDQWKSIAFQLGQMIALIRGQELYTKAELGQAFPDLIPALQRHSSTCPEAINSRRDELVDLVSDVYTRLSGSLNLFCYISSVKVKEWNRYSLQCRGIIIDLKSERVVAFPYEKFFKWNEIEGWRAEDLPESPLELVEKVDGSFVTAYRWEDQLRFACKGNFEAEQSQKAKQLSEAYDFSSFDFQRYSYTFEVVYPENRFPTGFASVDYKTEALYLTGIRDLRSGDLAPYSTIQALAQSAGLRWPQFHKASFQDALECSRIEEWTNFEGWVANFAGRRVKLKTRGYSRLNELFNSLRHGRHRILKDYVKLSESAWEQKLSVLPSEFRPLFAAEVELFESCKADLVVALEECACEIERSYEKQDFHQFVRTHVGQSFHKILFRRLRGQKSEALMDDLVLKSLLTKGRDSDGQGCQRIQWELRSPVTELPAIADGDVR